MAPEENRKAKSRQRNHKTRAWHNNKIAEQGHDTATKLQRKGIEITRAYHGNEIAKQGHNNEITDEMQRSQGHDNEIVEQGHINIQSSSPSFTCISPQSKKIGNHLCHVFLFLFKLTQALQLRHQHQYCNGIGDN